MKIPEKITLGAVEITVHEREEIDGGGIQGSCNAMLGVICLFNIEKKPPSKVEQTFFHELVHQILDQAGYNSGGPEGPYNEQFIDTFSLLLHQAVLQIIEAQK